MLISRHYIDFLKHLSITLFILCVLFMVIPVALGQSFSFHETGQPLGVSPASFYDIGMNRGVVLAGSSTIACGDMNNDGYIDLVLASNESSSMIQLYLNDGNGYFHKTADIFPVKDDPNPLWNFGIVISDLNNDGWQDIATADAWRGVNLYLNKNGTGFTWAQNIIALGVDEVKGIDAADINHDGFNDLVAGSHNGNDTGDRVYINDRTGHFVDTGQKIGHDITWDTVFGDLNNDGQVDYVSVNRYRLDPAKVHVNDGTGHFTRSIDLPTTVLDDSYDVKLADLNGDGLLDIVIANSMDRPNQTTSKIFINKGNFSFALLDSPLGDPDCETKDMDVVDIDNDGSAEIVLGNYNGGNSIYKYVDGTAVKLGIAVPQLTVQAIKVADLNNDGFQDIVLGSADDRTYHVYLNDGAGLQKRPPPASPAVLDSKVNGSVALLSWSRGFERTGAPLAFTIASASLGSGNAARLSVADLNGDGKPDIIVGNGEEIRESSEIYFNDASGGFYNSGQHFEPYALRDMALGDIDGDGDLDWVVATQGDGCKIYRNDGRGVFTLWQSIGVANDTVRSVDLGDLNGDGSLDLVYGSTGNHIFFNDGKGIFYESGQKLNDQYITQALKCGDLDSDGDLDYIQGNRILGNLDPADRAFVNSGSGFFSDSGQRLDRWSTIDVDLGDVDNDGDMDMVTASSVNGSNRLLLNDGKGVFTDANISLATNPVSDESKAVKFADIDDDGDLDIIFNDWNAGIVIFLNDGAANFVRSPLVFKPGNASDIAVADIDGDGDLDIVEAKKNGDGNLIYLSNEAMPGNNTFSCNLRIGTKRGSCDIADVALGPVLDYQITGLKPGTYYWCVESVDNSHQTSPWSVAGRFIVHKAQADTLTPVKASPSATPAALFGSLQMIVTSAAIAMAVVLFMRGRKDDL